ncbi:glycoside hydrolase family 43 protein [Enterococcus sp.]|uniref:glycoside hydrolase family 43 protein n=1 Tax=Enterococcus sp. TaxID=35783 RepID=UPI003C75C3EE
MIKLVKSLMTCGVIVALAGCQMTPVPQMTEPEFEDVTVHDPSVIKDGDEFYVIGSHMMFAKSSDLMKWEQVQSSVAEDQLFDDIHKELANEFEYAQTDTLWAGDIVQLKDGRYYMYYCFCQGTSPLSVLGVAVSDNVDGPYEKVESFLYSGTSPQFGETYNATKDPNVIDPDVFYDEEGKLWMVYGSYSGGIYIMEMNEETGLPKDRDSYGTKLIGGNHSRIEAPYIQYNKDTGYYYLFLSFGGLDSYGGYNMRVARSKTPNGPYEDSEGNLMSEVMGQPNTTFDDLSIEPFGVKLMGNFSYTEDDGLSNDGYVSPGHNSVYYDEEKNEYYLIFHTRFLNSGEEHSLRVHQIWFTEAGWPVVSPLRYGAEKIADYTKNQEAGTYDLISFTKEISDAIVEPVTVTLEKNGKITGSQTGTWQSAEKNTKKDSQVVVDGVNFKGKFISAWDSRQEAQVMCFTGTSEDGIPVFLVGRK